MEDKVRHNASGGASPTRWGSVVASLRSGALKGAVLAVVLAGVFGVALPSQAGEIANFFGIVLASLLQIIIGFVGDFFLLVVTVLINVATYNDFVVAVPVEQGWTIVRDITNMFFILVLLVIAFGTILGVKEWSYADKRLSGLLVMAVVVNFSRTICGLLIDFSQVVMLTFVYGFREAAGANFFTGLQLDKALESPLKSADSFLQKTADETIKTSTSVVFGAVVALILALLMIVGATIIVMYLTLMLIVRIVYLWLLVVLSPLAFFLKVVPGSMAKGQYADWWKRFNSQLVFGPLMAFFLWLSLVSVSSGTQLFKGVGSKADSQKISDKYTSSEAIYTFDGGQSAAFTTKVIQEYLIALCLMAGGAMMAQQIAGASASVAKSAAGTGIKAGVKAAKGAYRGARWTGGEMGRYAGMLPAGAKDPTTGMRPRLADRVGAWQQGRQDKKQAKVDLKEDDANLRKLSALRASPQNAAAAAALEKELIAKGAQRVSKGKSPKDLRDIVNDDSKSNIERQRAMLALAQQGDESLKGKGAEITGMVAKVGGSKDFELQARQALLAKGDQDAMVMNAKQVQDKMASASAKEKARMLEGIDRAVEPGADGRAKQTHATDRLLALEQKDMEQFSDRLKKQIGDALLKATMVASQGGNDELAANLESQYKTLNGLDVNKSLPDADVARAEQLMASMNAAGVKGRLAGGGAGYSAADTAAASLIADNDSDARRRADDRVRNIRERLAGGESVDSVRGEIADVMKSYEGIGAFQASQKGSDLRDASGKKMEGDEIVQAASFYKDLQAAQEATDPKAAADHMKAAMIGLEDAARKGGQSFGDAITKAMQNGASGLQRALGGFDAATGTGSDSQKLTAAKKATSQANDTINLIIKQAGGGISPEFKSELEGIKSQLKSIKSMKSIGEAETRTLQEIKKKMTAAQRKIS